MGSMDLPDLSSYSGIEWGVAEASEYGDHLKV